MKKFAITSFGSKGLGPGEFQLPSNLIEINSKKYCVDQIKMTLMIFDNKNNLFKEKKLNYQPLSIANVNNKICILKIPLKADEKILNFYSLDGKFLYKKMIPHNDVYGFNSYPKLSFLYSSVYTMPINNNLCIFFKWVPSLLYFNSSDNSSKLINYHKDLSFEPKPPVINFKKGNIFTAGLYWNEYIGNIEDNFIIKASNRKSLKEKESKKYFFQINKTDFSVEMVKVAKDENRLFSADNMFLHKGKLYIFNDEDEVIYVYRVKYN